MRGIGLAHRQGQGQPHEPRLDFQMRRALATQVAGVQIGHPLAKSCLISSRRFRIAHDLAGQNGVGKMSGNPQLKKPGQRQCGHIVWLRGFPLHNLVRNGRPEQRQASGLDGDTRGTKEISQEPEGKKFISISLCRSGLGMGVGAHSSQVKP